MTAATQGFVACSDSTSRSPTLAVSPMQNIEAVQRATKRSAARPSSTRRSDVGSRRASWWPPKASAMRAQNSVCRASSCTRRVAALLTSRGRPASGSRASTSPKTTMERYSASTRADHVRRTTSRVASGSAAASRSSHGGSARGAATMSRCIARNIAASVPRGTRCTVSRCRAGTPDVAVVARVESGAWPAGAVRGDGAPWRAVASAGGSPSAAAAGCGSAAGSAPSLEASAAGSSSAAEEAVEGCPAASSTAAAVREAPRSGPASCAGARRARRPARRRGARALRRRRRRRARGRASERGDRGPGGVPWVCRG